MYKYIIAGLVIIAGIVLFTSTPSFKGQPIDPATTILSNANTSSTVGLTSKTIIAAQSAAHYRTISNIGAGNVYISATTTGLVAGTGLYIKGSSTIELFGDKLIQGALYAIADATTTLSILQL